jgi:Lycopene cyclase
MSYHYSYLVGVLIFWVAWIACYAWGKDYRRQMLWGSLVAGPLGVTNILFVPQYWTPPSLFNLDERMGFGIEDILWATAVGGIASVVGEIFLKERLSRIRSARPKRHYAPFVVLVVVFALLELWHPHKTIYNTAAAFAAGAVVVAFLRPDLIGLMLTSGVVFAGLYEILFLYFLALYPDFIQRYYNVPNLLGIYVLGVPIEELMFASTGGAIWSVAYEYLLGYRVSTGKGI